MTTVTHTVLSAPPDPVRLRKKAQDRLEAAALQIRRAGLTQLFAAHGLNVEDTLRIDGTSVRLHPDADLHADLTIKLTRTLRGMADRKMGDRDDWRDQELSELVRKAGDYLRAEAYLAGRVRRLIETYIQRHVSPPAFDKLDRSSQTLLRAGSGPLRLAGPPDDHSIDEMIARIHARAPWMSSATTLIWHHLRAAHATGGSGLTLPPILLHGPPGTGKSTLARIIAEEAHAPVAELDAGTGTAGFRIAGVEAGWGSRQIGDVLRTVCEGRTANPVVVINEIDKIGGGVTSTSGTRTSMSDALLPLLEPSTAARWRCPASGLDCDMSRVVWIATANRIGHVDPVLRSRLEPIEIPALGHNELEMYVDLAIPAPDRDAVRRILAETPIGPRLTLRHVRRLADRLRGSERDEPLH